MIEPELLDPNSSLDLFIKETIAQNPSSQRILPSVLEKIQLSLEIIGRGMIEPELLDPNSSLDLFVNNPDIDPGETIASFLTKIKDTFKQGFLGNIAPKPFDPNAPATSEASSLFKNVFDLSKSFSSAPDLIAGSPLASAPLSAGLSKYFKTEGNSREDTLITCINGMNNTYEEAIRNAEHIRALCPGNPCIEGIYNHTNGKLIDFFEIFTFNYKGYSPITKGLLIQKWSAFHEKNKDRPNAKILHFCHSQGAIHTKNALMGLPKEIRDRIIVIAIAPAEVVPKVLCYNSFNYASETDIVPDGEILMSWFANSHIESDREEFLINPFEIQSELIRLKRHEDATDKLDHGFQSPTFDEKINFHLKNYETHAGAY